MNITVLVDFENDSVRTALEVAEALGASSGASGSTPPSCSWTARCGTRWAASSPPASTPGWCEKVRDALDGAGFADVRIVVSGGFTAERIREFEAGGVPVDAYGVGSSLIRGQNDFTADIVLVEGRPCAKVGRGVSPPTRGWSGSVNRRERAVIRRLRGHVRVQQLRPGR